MAVSAKISEVDMLRSGPTSVWRTPSDARNADLEAVSSYVSSLVDKAGPNDTTPANEYQDAAAERFGQPFEGEEWDAWFDKAVEGSLVPTDVVLRSVVPASQVQVPATSKAMALAGVPTRIARPGTAGKIEARTTTVATASGTDVSAPVPKLSLIHI